MNQLTPRLDRLPPVISGGMVALHAYSSPSSWSLIKTMGQQEKEYIYNDLPLPPSQKNCLSEYDRFIKFCDFIRPYEKHNPTNPTSYMPQRLYFSCETNSHRLVGLLRAYIPEADKNVLAVGYNTRPEFQALGYVTAAVEAVSNIALRKNVASSICSEVALDNKASARVLLKAGFTEAAHGLCSTANGDRGKIVRRFIKSTARRIHWPLKAIGD